MRSNATRVLHLINTLSVGGAERHLLDLLSHLPRREFEVRVAFFKEEAHEARSLVADFRDLGIPVHDLRLQGAGGTVAATTRLARLTREFTPTIVHTHLYRADLVGTVLRPIVGIPVLVSTVHNLDFETTYRRWRRFLFAAYRRANAVVAISHAVRAQLVERGLDPARVTVIHYGVAAGDAPEPSPARRPGAVIGTLGRLARQKGHDLLIDAFAKVLVTHPRAELLIAGHDDEGLRGELRARAERLGVEGSVSFLGYVDDVRAFLASLDVFVLPSRWEGFGLVLLEAMSAACPVVATRVGPVPEIVQHGNSGLLVEPGDSSVLAGAIAQLLDNAEHRRVMGRRGRTRALREFSVDRVARETTALYHSLLGAHHQRGDQRTRPVTTRHR